MDGVIIVDKPEGWTSHDVVGKMRRIAGTKRIGHLGTLDPIATGVLPLVIGMATRGWPSSTQRRRRSTKPWCASASLPIPTTAPVCRWPNPSPSCSIARDWKRSSAASSVRLQQVPPPVSAKKVGGVPSYKLARQNKAVELAPVEIEIYEARLTALEGDTASLLVRCSAGTYVRSMAHELGIAFGCGAHLHQLRRTRSGEFDISQARTIAALETLRAEDALPRS